MQCRDVPLVAMASSGETVAFEPARSARGKECKICVRHGALCNYHAAARQKEDGSETSSNGQSGVGGKETAKSKTATPPKRGAADDGGQVAKVPRGSAHAARRLKCPYCAKQFQRRLVLKVRAELIAHLSARGCLPLGSCHCCCVKIPLPFLRCAPCER